MAVLLAAVVCALAHGSLGAQPEDRSSGERGAAERQRHRQELREQLRGERLRAPDELPSEAGRRGPRDAAHLSPDERQALRQQLREQPPWRGPR